MAQRSYYELLGVSASAELPEIRGAFKRLIKKLHPDFGGSDQQAYNEALAAYVTLTDPEKRRVYDLGHTDIQTVADVFLKTQGGQSFMRQMLPSAPVEPIQGEDVYLPLEVRQSILETGGVIDVAIDGHRQPLTIPAHADLLPFCRIAFAGKSGRNGAPNGDLFLIVFST